MEQNRAGHTHTPGHNKRGPGVVYIVCGERRKLTVGKIGCFIYTSTFSSGVPLERTFKVDRVQRHQARALGERSEHVCGEEEKLEIGRGSGGEKLRVLLSVI